MRNARFWLFSHNGDWVKLTLKPSQTLSWGSFSEDEEGWTRVSQAWMHEGDRVRMSWYEDGTDCDGRLSAGGELVCPLEALTARSVDGLLVPDWDTEQRWQRDYAAEAMGY